MSDEMKPPRPREPFLSLVDRGAPPIPLSERLARLELNSDLTLKRLQQHALMIDGFGSTINRRFDVLHEEAALLRAYVANGKGDTVLPPPKVTARQAAVLTGKYASYVTMAAVVLRMAAKLFPQYGDAIDSVLGVFGL